VSIPTIAESRVFYRCAYQRLEEAGVLIEAGYTTGSIYLAGYAVECILKALILNAAPKQIRNEVLSSFRGKKAHEFEWLRTTYLTHQGSRFPKDITIHFATVNDWSTDLRYSPRSIRPEEAAVFLAAANAIIGWANERI
jgi:hypothetical protein